MLTDKTTDLAVLMRQPQRYIWGRIEGIEHIGPYYIVVFQPRKMNSDELDVSQPLHYAPYFKGRCLNTHSLSLDGALIIAIAHHRANPQRPSESESAAFHAAKLLNVPPDDLKAREKESASLSRDLIDAFQRVGDSFGFEGQFLAHYGYSQIEERVKDVGALATLKARLEERAKEHREHASRCRATKDVHGHDALAKASLAEAYWLEKLAGVEREEEPT